MTVGAEDMIVAGWLTSVLGGDATLQGLLGTQGVWDGPAPDNALYPLLRIDAQSPGYMVRGVGAVEVMADSLWLIRGIYEGTSYLPLKPIAERVHSLLHGAVAQVVTDGTIEAVARESIFRQRVSDAGKEFRHLGGIYRIYVQGS